MRVTHLLCRFPLSKSQVLHFKDPPPPTHPQHQAPESPMLSACHPEILSLLLCFSDTHVMIKIPAYHVVRLISNHIPRISFFFPFTLKSSHNFSPYCILKTFFYFFNNDASEGQHWFVSASVSCSAWTPPLSVIVVNCTVITVLRFVLGFLNTTRWRVFIVCTFF